MKEMKMPQENIETSLPNGYNKHKWWGVKKEAKPIDKKSNDIILALFKRLDIKIEDKK